MSPTESNQAVALNALRIPVNETWTNDHSAWTVVWLQAGRADFEPALKLAPLEPNGVLIIPAGNLVGFTAQSTTALRGYSLAFFPASLPCSIAGGTRVLLQNASQGKHDPTVLPDGNRLIPLLNALADARAHDLPSVGGSSQLIHTCPCPLVTRLNAVIDELLKTVKGVQSSNGNVGQRVMGILSGLQQRELQSITIDELARRCGCSRRHLARLIREQCGDSLSAIVNGVRLEKAAELLLDPTRKLVDVAPDCGFNHLGSFSKRFRERFGLTPAAWRKQKLGLKDANGVPPETAQGQALEQTKAEPAQATLRPSLHVRRGVKAKAKGRSGKSKTAKTVNSKWTVRKVHSAGRSKVKLNQRLQRKRR